MAEQIDGRITENQRRRVAEVALEWLTELERRGTVDIVDPNSNVGTTLREAAEEFADKYGARLLQP